MNFRNAAAGLTQEDLGQRAGVNADGIQKLERGTMRPYRDTSARFVAALRAVRSGSG